MPCDDGCILKQEMLQQIASYLLSFLRGKQGRSKMNLSKLLATEVFNSLSPLLFNCIQISSLDVQ